MKRARCVSSYAGISRFRFDGSETFGFDLNQGYAWFPFSHLGLFGTEHTTIAAPRLGPKVPTSLL